MTLLELIQTKNIKTDKHYTIFEQSQHTYVDVYDQIFFPYKQEKLSVCEIGVLRGESLKLWHEYFVNSKIYGVDTFERSGWADWQGCSIEDVTQNLSGYNRASLHQANSFSDNFDEDLKRFNLFNSLPNKKFDIIIDDGSHELMDQVRTFNVFSKALSEDGLYVIEDIGITDGSAFEPTNILTHIPELNVIDMRHVGYHDNVLAIYYKQGSKHSQYLDDYVKSEAWKQITK